MAKYLFLDGANWRLHVSEDAATLDERLRSAAEAGSLVQVQASLPDLLQDHQMVTVNPQAVGHWTVVELPDADSHQ